MAPKGPISGTITVGVKASVCELVGDTKYSVHNKQVSRLGVKKNRLLRDCGWQKGKVSTVKMVAHREEEGEATWHGGGE